MAKYIVIHGIRIDKDYQNFVPETFGRLTTIGPKFQMQVGITSKSFQVCQCGCKDQTFVIVTVNSLRSGNTGSCGCIAKNAIAKAHKSRSTHLDTGSTEYIAWCSMRQRCYNKKNKVYAEWGGRGIRVCDRWLDPVNGYANFLADMGRRPVECDSIDRIDNEGNYELGNCRWATTKEQGRNKRNNRMLTAFRRTQCLSAWAEETGISFNTISRRLNLGWDAEKALTKRTEGKTET